MGDILLDTSVYIAALRQGNAAVLSLRRAARASEARSRPLWLSMVVLEELYVGAQDKRTRQTFERLEREFATIGRLLVPQRRDWSLAGQVLAQIGQQYGYDLVGGARMTNDALIAMSAASQGLTVLTKNPQDYQLMAEFRPFHFEAV